MIIIEGESNAKNPTEQNIKALPRQAPHPAQHITADQLATTAG
jgi:hypothetical protein